MRCRSLGAALLCLTVACAPEQNTNFHHGAIINGTDHTGHPAVGRIFFTKDGSTSACTATLVGAKTVLTAAHCLGYPDTEFVDGTYKHKSVKSVKHTKYSSSTPYLYDIGLVLLKTAPQVTPARITLKTPQAGQAVKLIGFGETSQGAGDNNVKRLGTNTIAAVEPLYFTVDGASGSEGNACLGDSGGPVFFTEGGTDVVGGVMSFITGSCGATSRHTRLDLYQTWLQQESTGDIRFYSAGQEAGAGDAGAGDAGGDQGPITPTDGGSDSGLSDGGEPSRPTDECGCHLPPEQSGGVWLLLCGLVLWLVRRATRAA